jgi:hypothetical protein
MQYIQAAKIGKYIEDVVIDSSEITTAKYMEVPVRFTAGNSWNRALCKMNP